MSIQHIKKLLHDEFCAKEYEMETNLRNNALFCKMVLLGTQLKQ